MILKIFTKEDSPETRQAKELGPYFEERKREVEYFEADSQEAVQQIELYDIYSYPSFVVARDDGTEVECWRGTVPLKDDILNFLDR